MLLCVVPPHHHTGGHAGGKEEEEHVAQTERETQVACDAEPTQFPPWSPHSNPPPILSLPCVSSAAAGGEGLALIGHWIGAGAAGSRRLQLSCSGSGTQVV